MTLSRIIFGAGFIGLGLSGSEDAIGIACLLLIVSWTTDLLDGWLARHDPQKQRSWIGDHDLQVDMVVSLSVLVYLVLDRWLVIWLASIYVCLWFVVFIYSTRVPSMGKMVQAPVYMFLIWFGIQNAPLWGWILLLWLVITFVTTWPRFLNDMRCVLDVWKERLGRKI